jgi:hypothetical protein
MVNYRNRRVIKAQRKVDVERTREFRDLPDFNDLPKADSCRLIDFDRAKVLALETTDPPQYFLVVLGTKPFPNMEVRLVPRKYVQQPEYWGIEVVGSLPSGGGPDPTAPYVASIPLANITGTKGIEVIGATRSEWRDIPPVGPPADCYEWSAWHNRQPPGPVRLHVQGKCKFPTEGYSAELRFHEPQGINPRDLLLDLIIREPKDPVLPVVTEVDVRYEEETDAEYETVTILGYASMPVQVVW